MAKCCLEKYPLGSLPRQKTAGRYIDGYLYENLRPLAKKIVNDMTWLAIIYSSTLEVGTGKSVFAQQLAEAYLDLVYEEHGIKNDFTKENLVFRPKKLIEQAFKVPKYSVIVLDEWEDAHYWSALGMSLRQFFRKCRQLNLFMIVIIPNFFEMPKSYAISRSIFAVDVWFAEDFERGYFSFYNYDRKKDLYIKGKKMMNYKVCRPNFVGRFLDGYAMSDEEYRRLKYLDMLQQDREEQKKEFDPKTHNVKLVKNFREKCPEITIKQLAKGFGVSERTITRHIGEGSRIDMDSEQN